MCKVNSMFIFFLNFMKLEFTVHLSMALTILLQLNRDDARLFSTEGLGEHQFFSVICMHCNKKVAAMSQVAPPLQKILRTPLMLSLSFYV